MLSFLDLMKGAGYLGLAFLTLAIDWYHICFLGAASSFVYLVIVVLVFPESPTFLMIQGKRDEAKEILVRLRGSRKDIEKEVKELELLNQREDGQIGWKALLSKDSLKSLLIINSMHIILSLSGISVMTVSITRNLQAVLPSLDSSIITLLTMTGYFCGSLILFIIVDRIGRRWCLRISLFLMAVAYIVLGTLSYLDNSSFQVHIIPSVANASDVLYNTEER